MPSWLSSSTLITVAIGVGVGFLASYALTNPNIQKTTEDDDKDSENNDGDVDSSEYKSKNSFELPLPLRDSRNNPLLSVEAMETKAALNDITDAEWEGKRVLMRVDYNVKVKNGIVGDRKRIVSTLDTLKFLLSKPIKCVVLLTHLGRPVPNVKSFDPLTYSLEPVAKCLQEYLPGATVRFLNETIGPRVEAEIQKTPQGSKMIYLMENVRYHAEETGIKFIENKDGSISKEKCSFNEKVTFRKALSRLGDLFVFEAFGAAHRPHSSIIGISHPRRVAGLLMQKELKYYAQVLGRPQRPFLAIIGGAKVSDKILVLENLLNLVDEMIIGGGMAYTFKKVLDNMKIGNSLFDKDGSGVVLRIMEKARERGVTIHFPTDHVIANKFDKDAKVGVTDDNRGVPDEWLALDIGPHSRAHNSTVIGRAKTILWNGPLGVYEMGPFGGGTISAMMDIVEATKRGATTIIGGGDTASAASFFFVGDKSVSDQVSHVSTGGGSSLVLMEGKMLPAVVALSKIGENIAPPEPKEEDEMEDVEEE